MSHAVLIQNSVAQQVWRNTLKADLPPMHPDILSNVIDYDGDVSDGWAWDGTTFVDPALSSYDALSAEVRATRNMLLTRSDWTQLSDAPVDSLKWAIYRQELRDLTAQAGFPDNVTWPVPPS